MKTRSHKSRILIATVIGLSAMSPSSWAQFNKFKSKTRFNQQSENSAAQGARGQAQNGGSENFEQGDSNQETFGDRPVKRPPPGEQESKYVQLNPETAFGPEIITSFDFPDTDILELTKHMQKLTGINLILDKDVKGKVSIMAPSPITVGDAWKAYLAALNMAGYTLVKSGEFYKVINARDVRYVPTAIYTGSYTPDTEAHVMKILALKNVDASEISRNFRPFMSRYGRIIDIKQTNTIIISDTGANINRLERLIKFLDVPGHEESLHILPVKNSSAQEIAKLLDEILGGNQSGGSSRARRGGNTPAPRFSGGDRGSNISKIIAEQRTNSIIAMANAEGARQLKDLVEKLDVKLVSQSSGRVHVHYLNYGNAEELAKTLSTLISGSGASSSRSASARARAIRGRGADDEDAIFNDEVKVTADKNNNALVVTASPTDWLTLKNVIGKLDIPRDQVYVEGIIMETNLTKVRAFGVEYLGAYGSGNAQRGGFLAGGGLVDLLSGNPTGLSGLFVGGGAGGTVEIPNPAGGDPLKVNSVNGLIKAIASNTSSNVLATPQILAMDNTDAEFEVGETVPVRNTTTATNGTTQTTVTNQEAKLSLKITPQINKVTRFVNLKINQTINAFRGDSDSSGNGQATTTRSAVTEVMVRDRDTIAMGGLLRDNEEVTYSKVPLLGDIPVLGWLFKNKSRTVRKVNLLMFLTPKILSPYDKEANPHTLGAIERASDAMKKTAVDGELPFKGELTSLAEKVRIQATESKAPENVYQESNESEGIERSSAPVDEADYQDILESIEQE